MWSLALYSTPETAMPRLFRRQVAAVAAFPPSSLGCLWSSRRTPMHHPPSPAPSLSNLPPRVVSFRATDARSFYGDVAHLGMLPAISS